MVLTPTQRDAVPMTLNFRFSLVIPVKDEAESLPALVDEIAATLSGEPFEVVVVDDGSTDATPAVLRQLAHRHPFIRTRVHERCCGKSAALVTGVRAARAELIATLDGDGQNDPRYLPPLLRLAAEPRVGLAAGQRRKHAHSWAKKIGSRFANRLRSSPRGRYARHRLWPEGVSQGGVSSASALRQHAQVPACPGDAEGFEVRHLDVTDRQRRHGASKYGVIDRALAGALDLIGVWWLIRRRLRDPQSRETASDSP